MPNWLKNLVLKEVSFVDRPANKGARVVLCKSKNPPAPGLSQEEGKNLNQEADMADEQTKLELEAKIAELQNQLDAKVTSEKSEVAKAETITKERDDLKAKVEKMEAAEEIQKNSTELAELKSVVKMEEFAPTIQKLRKADKDATDSMLSLLKTLVKQADAGLLSTIGKSGEVLGTETALDTLAKARSKEKSISFEKAYSEVLTEHPELYEKTLNGRG